MNNKIIFLLILFAGGVLSANAQNERTAYIKCSGGETQIRVGTNQEGTPFTLKCGEAVTAVGEPTDGNYEVITWSGRRVYIPQSYLSLVRSMPSSIIPQPQPQPTPTAASAPAPAPAPPAQAYASKKGRGAKIAEMMRAAQQGMLDSQTNYVCNGHGGARSWRTVEVNTSMSASGRGSVYSSTGTYLGTVSGSSDGRATTTARIAACKDGTEHLF